MSSLLNYAKERIETINYKNSIPGNGHPATEPNHSNLKGGCGMKKNDENRRSFLKSLLAGSAVVAGVATTAKAAQIGAAKNRPPVDETLYRETDAFKEYYQSLGYQSKNS